MTSRSTISAVALTLAVTLGTPAAARTDVIANSFYNAEHPLSKCTSVGWADMLPEASGGDLDPEVYTGTVLLAPRATLQGIRGDVVQVGSHLAVYTPS